MLRRRMATQATNLELVSSSKANITTGTSLVITTPSGAASGDLLLAFLVNGTTSGAWTVGTFTSRINTGGVCIATLALAGAPAANYTFTASASGEHAGILVCVRGGSYGLIGSADVSAPVSAPSITMASPGFCFVHISEGVQNRSFGAPTGMTLVDSFVDATYDPTIGVYYESVVAGATGNRPSSGADDGDFGVQLGVYEA